MAGIYHNATLGLISLSSDGENWITIADKNLGATSTDVSSENSYGNYYQRGNCYGFKKGATITTSSTKVNASSYGPSNYYSDSTFRIVQVWDTSNNSNLWGGTGTVLERKGPCDVGFHIPNRAEINGLMNIMSSLGLSLSTGASLNTYLFAPYNGYMGTDSTNVGGIGSYGYWYISEANGTDNAYSVEMRPASLNYSTYSDKKGYGLTIRPFKNEAEIPYADEGRTKLYGDDLPPRPEPPVPVKKLKWLMNKGNFYYFDEAPIHASSVTLNESSITLTEAGQTYQLTATVAPYDAVIKKVHWSSSDITVATVTQTGLVTCITPGECTITAECDGVSATCDVVATIEAYIEFLLVGGGGGGGNVNETSGGGGAGGLLHCCNYLITSGQYCIVVGDGGGTGQGYSQTNGFNGCNSTFDGIIAYGGGGGVTSISEYATRGCDGGSGGGGGCDGGGSGCSGQGYSGGKGSWYSSLSSGGGGGGGAGGPGCCGSRPWGGAGGPGITLNISGTSYTYSKGGDGSACCGSCGTPGNGVHYGDGGGGACGCYGYCGHSGIFITRYPTDCGYNITGGCKYTCGDYTIHCFTSNGTLTVG